MAVLKREDLVKAAKELNKVLEFNEEMCIPTGKKVEVSKLKEEIIESTEEIDEKNDIFTEGTSKVLKALTGNTYKSAAKKTTTKKSAAKKVKVEKKKSVKFNRADSVCAIIEKIGKSGMTSREILEKSDVLYCKTTRKEPGNGQNVAAAVAQSLAKFGILTQDEKGVYYLAK